MPAAVSMTVLIGVVALAVFVGLRIDPLQGAATETRRRRVDTLVRDVLTGRRLDADGRPVRPESGWGSDEKPIRMRFVPSSDVSQTGPTIRELVAFLERRTGYRIEGATLQSYGLVVQELVQGRCEVAFLTATSYARARFATENNDDPTDEIAAFLQAVRRGNEAWPQADLAYRAAIIVRNDSPIRSLDDLTDEHVVAMGARTSGAGSILPSALFNEMGLEPRIQRYEGSYPIIVNAVLQGAVDIGTVWWSPPNEDQPQNDARQTVLESHPDVFERTRIVGFTGWMPNEPVVIRAALSEEIRRILGRAISLYVAEKSLTKEGLAELASVGNVVGFIPATNADFDVLMDTIERAFANDPEGFADFRAGMR
ncbi:MAG: phosphate/phosphite/phosphonate ABC transporter substrate-binding protein [Planctomycetota bacterium]